jgi:chromate transport protein ChrA
MKKNIVILAPIAVVVLSVLVFALSSLNDERFNALQWLAAICGFLAFAWIIAMLLNVALFAPVFWLLGRLQSKKSKTDTKHDPDA